MVSAIKLSASPRNLMSFKSTAIPLEQAYTVKNTSPPSKIREVATERLPNSITLDPAAPVGTVLGKYFLNPLMMPGTRLSGLAKNYVQFRFRACKLIYVSSISTATSGAIVGAYSPNPDLSLGPNANTTLFAMNGVSASIFVRTEIKANFLDKAKWYNIDADSAEIMNTTQGFFALAVDQTITLSSAVQATLNIEYDIEFRGAVPQTYVTATVSNVAPGNWVLPANTTSWTIPTITPPLVNGNRYLLSPAVSFSIADVDVTATYGQQAGGVLTLYENYEDVEAAKPIDPPVAISTRQGQTQFYQLVSN